ncbi:MAG: ABC transporter ATP-binding protein [Bacteriovoracaceae bacterium]|nr:ABC transporter ATP-binding protein [Bacteriovoracaceae bacterium]
MAGDTLVTVDNVEKKFGKMIALGGVTLSLAKNSQYVITGASGSGKSTLLYLLGGLDIPSKGDIFIEGRNLTSLGDELLATFRNKFVGFVFQFHFLLPTMDCMNNILLPARIGGFDISKIKEETTELAGILGITHCLSKYPFELSGGEQQRVNIVRSLSLKPKLLLCDEPTGNLDSQNSDIVITLLMELTQKYGSTLVVVTHDRSVAARFKNRFTLRDGKVDSLSVSGV